jgi:hypothetical protein
MNHKDDPYADLPECCCAGMEENKRLKKRVDELEYALQEALNGINWWVENFPQVASTADDEKIEEFKRLLK